MILGERGEESCEGQTEVMVTVQGGMKAQGATRKGSPGAAAPTLPPEIGASHESVPLPHDFLGLD